MTWQSKRWRTIGSTQTGYLSTRTSGISETILRARLRNTPDLTSSTTWFGITSLKLIWHYQSKVGVDLIRDISGLRRHLSEGFTRCRPTSYSPSIIIILTELLYRQPGPVDPADSARVAKNLRQILYLLCLSALSCNFINTMRKRSPSYSLVIALRKPSRYGRASFRNVTLLRMEAGQHVLHVVEGGNTGSHYQATIHRPAWIDLVFRLRGQDSVSGKVSNTLHWDLLSMAISPVEPTLKLYHTCLPKSRNQIHFWAHRASSKPTRLFLTK